jgi:ubiquinone/menaquinone biosynthesis C-methylase UbiE
VNAVHEKERVRGLYEKEAPRYDRQMGFFERILFAGNREWVCSRAAGDVLEVAVGTGRNLPFYPDGVRLTAIEFSPAMLELARQRARDLGREADLRAGDAERLQFEDGSFDTVVCTYGLCTIPDDRSAVLEMARVLRPSGRLLLAEHVRSPARIIRAGQRLLEPLMVRLEGDHLLREPLERVEAAGLEVDELERSKLGIVELLSATKPAQPTNEQPSG